MFFLLTLPQLSWAATAWLVGGRSKHFVISAESNFYSRIFRTAAARSWECFILSWISFYLNRYTLFAPQFAPMTEKTTPWKNLFFTHYSFAHKRHKLTSQREHNQNFLECLCNWHTISKPYSSVHKKRVLINSTPSEESEPLAEYTQSPTSSPISRDDLPNLARQIQ